MGLMDEADKIADGVRLKHEAEKAAKEAAKEAGKAAAEEQKQHEQNKREGMIDLNL